LFSLAQQNKNQTTILRYLVGMATHQHNTNPKLDVLVMGNWLGPQIRKPDDKLVNANGIVLETNLVCEPLDAVAVN
jgi:hypothetical protein